jgi:hypothetical protein
VVIAQLSLLRFQIFPLWFQLALLVFLAEFIWFGRVSYQLVCMPGHWLAILAYLNVVLTDLNRQASVANSGAH